jgi:hypothetical protein
VFLRQEHPIVEIANVVRDQYGIVFAAIWQNILEVECPFEEGLVDVFRPISGSSE